MMKSRFPLQMTAFCLLLILAIQCCPGLAEQSADDAEADLSALVYHNVEGMAADDMRSGFVYRDAMLFGNAGTFSPELCKASAVLAAAGYTGDAAALLSSDAMGYQAEFYAPPGGISLDDYDSAAYTVGTKGGVYDPATGRTYTICCIVIRGTPGNLEWVSDFNLGRSGETGGKHIGFYTAANRILGQLQNLSAIPHGGNTIYWFTGHSRGAAIANIIAARYTDLYGSSRVFAYTFACPSVSKSASEGGYGNIFNIINSGDLIPTLPLADWGYKRYGHTMIEWFGADDVFYQRFSHEMVHGYRGTSDTLAYVELFKRIVPSEEKYHDKVGQAAITAMALQLGNQWGKEGVGEWYVRNYLVPAVGNLALDLLLNTIGIQPAINLLSTMDDVFDAEEAFLWDTRKNCADMTEEEFAEYLEAHKDMVRNIEKATGILITAFGNVNPALAAVIALKDPATTLGECLACVLDLVGQTNDPKQGIWDAHMPNSYVLYVNAKYFGYEGWMGSDPGHVNIMSYYPIETIGQRCFSGCGLTQVSLNQGLKYIGPGAFANCSGLAEFPFPETLVGIGQEAFSNTGLVSVALPAGESDALMQIGDRAFQNCAALESAELKDALSGAEIGTGILNGCTALKDVVIPADVSTKDRFLSCAGVETLRFTKGTTGVLADCALSDNDKMLERGISAASLREVIFDEGVTRIGSYSVYAGTAALDTYDGKKAAVMNDVLLAVSLPSTLESVGDFAFACRQQADFSLPAALKDIGRYAFCASGITFVTLPAGESAVPVNIAEYAFWKCARLERVELKDAESMASIEYGIFSECGVLKEVVIPADVSTKDRFVGCVNVESIRFTPGSTGILADADKDYAESYLEREVSAKALKTVVFDEGITRIGNRAFDPDIYRPYYQTVDETLLSVSLPSTLQSVGDYAFDGRSHVDFSDLPAALTDIGRSAFAGTGTTSITLPVGDSTVPVNLGDCAFEGCDLQRVELKDAESAAQIGTGVFSYCGKLKEVVIPVDISTLNRFMDCDQVETIRFTPGSTGVMPDHYGSDTDLERYLERKVTVSSLKTVIFEEGITRIGACALDARYWGDPPETEDALVSVSFPSTLKSIGDFAFQYRAHIDFAALDLPAGLEEIGNYAFACTGTTSVTLPHAGRSGPVDVGWNAFFDCPLLTYAELKDIESEAELGDHIFSCCEALTDLVLPVDVRRDLFDMEKIETIRFTPGLTGVLPDLTELEYVFSSQTFFFETVIFEEGITRIGDYAFAVSDPDYGWEKEYGSSAVSFPSTLQSIGQCAFQYREAITELSFPAVLETIGDRAFDGCIGVQRISFAGNAPQFGTDCFGGVTAEASYDPEKTGWTAEILLPYGGTITWANARPHANLTEASLVCSALGFGQRLPLAVTMPGGAPVECTLQSSDPDVAAVYGSQAVAVGEGTAVITVTFGEYTEQVTVTVTNAPTLMLPSALTGIEAEAFAGDAHLQLVYMPQGVTAIGSRAFANCEGLVAVCIPDSVTNLAEDAFEGCAQAVILCPADSAAWLYAQAKGIPAVAVE